ncbi:amidase domain-containing protein [Leifsonia sp. LS1]|uniref:amidase domain-containing protein n=1 Tax=Leifsonia sp. LS1 TaxID=2828483 RepID=UPI001CFE6E95|nr:amidase domain-containing protein [Leifsonia sp. LS1]
MKRSLIRWAASLGAVASMAMLTGLVGDPAGAVTAPDANQWIAAIKSDVEHRNDQALVASERKSSLLRSAPVVTQSRQAAIVAEETPLREQASWFAAHGDAFTASTSVIDIISSSVSGDTSTVKFRETTTMKRAPLADGTPLPDYEYGSIQKAELSRVDGAWKVAALSHDPLETATTMYSPALLTEMKNGSLEPGYQKWKSDLSAGAQVAKQGPAAVALTSVSKTAIVSYANAYWNNYNTAYVAQSNDCTNFVSQALLAGGWGQTATGDKNDVNRWFYNGLNNVYEWSKTWINAQWQNAYGTNHGLLTQETNAHFLAGDIAYFIWNESTSDGTMDHAGIVTQIVGTEPYFTYHTSNQHNASWTQVKARAVASGEAQYTFQVQLFDFHA